MNRIVSRMLSLIAVLGVAGIALLAGGCNTMSGVGQDISAAGQTLSDWAGNDAPKQ